MLRQNLSGKRAILYRRVSTDEQAKDGYSLRAQTEHLRRFCEQAGITVACEYEDDGYSGKNFERPAYRQMLLERDGTGADYLLVTKWSRFARNVDDARAEINRWASLGVEVQATEQWVNYADPNHLYVLLINLVEPDVANRWLSISVKQGMRRAMREGRWVARPPVGYRRVRDADDRPYIAPDPEQAEIVAGAFELAADPSLPLAEVHRRARRLGLNISRSSFYEMLKNPIYTGRISLTAWKDEPAEIVEALHAAIVDEHTFARVQERFAPNSYASRRRGQRTPRPEFPLRGHLLCPHCKRKVTGSRVKGRSAYYAYYDCHYCSRDKARRIAGVRYRHRAGVVHEAFHAFLGSVEISREFAVLHQAVSQEREREQAAQAERRARKIRAEIEQEDDRLARAEDLYIDGKLKDDALERATARYDERTTKLRATLAEVEAAAPKLSAEHTRFGYDVLADLTGLWERGDAEARGALTGSIWPAGVVFDGDGFETTPESELIVLLAGKKAEKETATDIAVGSRPVRYARQESNLRPPEPESGTLSS